MRSFFSQIRNGVSNLIKWFPVVWSDRDFDQAYLYRIVHKKLLNMEEFFNSKHTFSVEALQVAKEIKDVREMIGRVIHDEHHQKVEISTDAFMNVENGKFNVDREHPIYIKWMAATEEAERKTREDLRVSFKIIGENSQDWWD